MATKKPRSLAVPMIPVSQLILDESNPRFGQVISQDEMISMFASQDRTLGLARHIAKNGLDPLSLLAITPIPNKANRFIVREGNRRLAAVKLLGNPVLAGSASVSKKYQKLIDNAEVSIPDALPCAIFDGDDVNEWISIKHSGVGDGEGTSEWDTAQKTRFEQRTGRTSQHSSTLGLVDFGVKSGCYSREAADSVAITSLTRLLGDSDVQSIWGLEDLNQTGTASLTENDVKKLATHLVSEWKKFSGRKVGDIYSKGDRLSYAKEVAKKLKLKPGTGTTPLITSTVKEGQRPATRTRLPSHSSERRTLVPRDIRLNITRGRIRDIYLELKQLDVNSFPNAVAVLFRSFIEFSAEHHLKQSRVSFHENSTLADKVTASCDHLLSTAGVDKNVVMPVRKAISTKGLFTIKTFNQYVHNLHENPIPRELNLQWNNFEPYFLAVWGFPPKP